MQTRNITVHSNSLNISNKNRIAIQYFQILLYAKLNKKYFNEKFKMSNTQNEL